jgi:RimJ/RimL family protein N-acetyltransferase
MHITSYISEHLSVDEAQHQREKLAEDEWCMAFHVHLQNSNGTTTFVGVTGLHDIDASHDLCATGITISPEYHRGIATEVLYTWLKFTFEGMEVHRINFETGPDNVIMSARQLCL